MGFIEQSGASSSSQDGSSLRELWRELDELEIHVIQELNKGQTFIIFDAIALLSHILDPTIEIKCLSRKGKEILGLCKRIDPSDEPELIALVKKHLGHLKMECAIKEGLGGGIYEYSRLTPAVRALAMDHPDKVERILRENPKMTWSDLFGTTYISGIDHSYIINETDLLSECLKEGWSLRLLGVHDGDSLKSRKNYFDQFTADQKKWCRSPVDIYIEVVKSKWGELPGYSGAICYQIAAIFKEATDLVESGAISPSQLIELVQLRKETYKKDIPLLAGLLKEGVDWQVFKTHLPHIIHLLKQNVDKELLHQMLPALFNQVPFFPRSPNIPIDGERWEQLKDRELLKEKMRGAGNLFECVDSQELNRIGEKVAAIAQGSKAKEAVSELASYIHTEAYNPQFWNHPMFLSDEIDEYILLAHLMDLISTEELATLHTMVASLRYYKKEGIPVMTMPLFLEDGLVNRLAKEMAKGATKVGHKQARKNQGNRFSEMTPITSKELGDEWFLEMRELPPLQRYFLYLPRRSLEERMALQSETTIMERIVDVLDASVLSKIDEQMQFIPSVGGALKALDFLCGFGSKNVVFHYGLGIPAMMREEHKKSLRTVSLQTSFFPIPELADGFFAPGAELTLHDLVYHFYVASFIPFEDMNFFMDLSSALEERANGIQDELLRAVCISFVFQIIDSEFYFYRSNNPKHRLLFRNFEYVRDRIMPTIENILAEKHLAQEEYWKVFGLLRTQVTEMFMDVSRSLILKYRGDHPGFFKSLEEKYEQLLRLEYPSISDEEVEMRLREKREELGIIAS